MSTLQRPVRQAQRRLWVNRFFVALGWSMAGAAAAFIAVVLIDRIWLATEHPGRLLGYSALALAAAAAAGSLLWSLLTRERFDVAAAKLDLAANLRERLSSGLYCEHLDDPFARAVVADAQKTAAKITVKRHLPLEVPRSAGWAGGSLVVALLFFWLFPAVDLSGKQEERAKEIQRQSQVKRTEAVLRPMLEQQMRKLVEKNPSLKKDLEDLEPLQNAKLDTPADVRREAIKKVEKAADKLEERKNSSEVAKVQEFQQMMRRIADQQMPNNTPVGELAKSLAQGDFKGAKDSLDQIKSQLSKEPKTAEEKQAADQMKAQLDQLSNKIEQIAKDQKKTQDQLAQKGMTKEEVKQALDALKNKDTQALQKMLEKKGLTQQQIQQMMQQMQKRQDAADAAKQLAQNMQKAAQQQQGKQGQQQQQAQKAQQGQQGQQGQQAQQGQQGQQAQGQKGQQGQQGNEMTEGEQGFDAASQQLSDMEALQQQLNELDSGLADLESLKNDMGKQGSEMGDPNRRGSGMGDLGRGEGGVRQQQQTDIKTIQKRSPVNTLPGKINSQQFIDGEQFKGDVSPEYRDAAMAAQRDVSDAIAREQIPRALQQPVSKYFTRSAQDAQKAK